MVLSRDEPIIHRHQGAHGVIFLFDVTKAWTFEYVTREVSRVPAHIPVLVLANFIDRAHHRAVTREQALGFIEHLEGKRRRRKSWDEMRNTGYPFGLG